MKRSGDASELAPVTPAAPELFGAAWVERFERELAADGPFLAAAAKWKGSVALSLLAGGSAGSPAERGIFLDLAHGSPHSVRTARAEELANANVCLSAPADVWIRLLEGELEPASAIMGGGLRLTRGSLFSLLPHIKAAQALLECARRVPMNLPRSRT